ncbi:hypothetical protein ACIQXV_26215 [Neobacillus sp. NPDC097160]|uniref:hypothetical protein n=1 Tax=Neobacillus sp. NPDC097160 TaxID=3364298 RepID=UPI003823FEDA
MLTTAQQKVKQELEELQANALFHHEPEPAQSNQQRSMKKRAYITIGIFALMIIITFLMIEFLTPTHEKTISYLAIEQQYNRQSEKLLSDCKELHTADIENAKADQTALLKKVKALETPSSLQDHKHDLLDVMKQRQDILTYLASAKNSNSLTLNKKLIELNIKQELALDSLRKAFDREKIKYLMHENGTIQYWVNGNVYEY